MLPPFSAHNVYTSPAQPAGRAAVSLVSQCRVSDGEMLCHKTSSGVGQAELERRKQFCKLTSFICKELRIALLIHTLENALNLAKS